MFIFSKLDSNINFLVEVFYVGIRVIVFATLSTNVHSDTNLYRLLLQLIGIKIVS